MSGRALIVPALAGAAAVLAGCEGAQSVLAPAGREAQVLYDIWWVLLIGAVVIWLLLNGTFFWFSRVRRQPTRQRWAEAVIIGGGVGFPTIGLAALLLYTLPVLAELRQVEGEPGLHVQGERWWWRVVYLTPDGPIEAANEIRLPVGETTLVSLGADRVIHSFWVPALSGKLDMFPGRETRLPLEPLRAGVFRGQCAELCGDSHALMAFQTIVMEPADYADWLAAEARPAAAPADAQARRGREVFMAEGCGACHALRGTPADGRFGPDLTHVGSRTTLAAGTLENSDEAMADWLRRPGEIKPGVEMPAFAHLAPEAMADLVHFLRGLE